MNVAAQPSVAALNDTFRLQLLMPLRAGAPGRVMLTRGVAALAAPVVRDVLNTVATFALFTPANDPYGEHDCATFALHGERFIWKIDYYADEGCTYGAEDPRACYRVLTIMLATEY